MLVARQCRVENSVASSTQKDRPSVTLQAQTALWCLHWLDTAHLHIFVSLSHVRYFLNRVFIH
jgi:hypothetical protein